MTFLSDRTAARSMIGYCHDTVVCLSARHSICKFFLPLSHSAPLSIMSPFEIRGKVNHKATSDVAILQRRPHDGSL